MVWKWGPCRLQGCSFSTFISFSPCYWSPFDSNYKDWQQKHSLCVYRWRAQSSSDLSLVALFSNLDLDLLVGRTASNHSWRNPVERIISVINLGLQCVGIMRQGSSEFKKAIKNANNLNAVIQVKPSKLQAFFDHCCQIRHYSFCIMKCGSSECEICKPVRMDSERFKGIHFLPDPVMGSDDHCIPFTDEYVTNTSANERPSLIQRKRWRH